MKTFLRVLAALCIFLLGMTLVGGQPNPARQAAPQATAQRPAPMPVASRDEDDEEEEEDDGEDDRRGRAAPSRAGGERSGDVDMATRDASAISTVPSPNPGRVDKATLPAVGEAPGVPPVPAAGPRAEQSRVAEADERRNEDEDDREERMAQADAGEDDEGQPADDPAAGDAGGEPPLPERAPPVSKRNPRIASEPLGPPPPPQTWTAAEISAAKAVCGKLINEQTFDFRSLEPIREGACGAPAPISLSGLTLEVERERVKQVEVTEQAQQRGEKPNEIKDEAQKEKPQEAKTVKKTIEVKELVKEDLEVELSPPVTATCPLSAAVERWMREVVLPKAKQHLQDEVVELVNVSAYQCRTRYNSPSERISYHAYAEAIDISGFRMAKGEVISVEQHWEGAAAKSSFLQEIHAGACRIFGTVLGPRANAAHRNHFHLDMAKRRFSAYCQ